MPGKIKFGTDGWRGLIGEDFSFANVKRIAGAISLYIHAGGDAGRGVVVGCDRRFLSPESAGVVAHTLAARGIQVILADDFTPTPAVSYAVVARHAAAGVMITASHNPSRWNGVKIKASYGGSAAPSMIEMAEKGRTLAELVEDLTNEFGPHFYGRRDIEIGRPAIERALRLVKDHKIKSIAGHEVSSVEDLDGFKMLFGDSRWLLVRASGTENLIRLYAEAPAAEEVTQMLAEMAAIAQETPKSSQR